MRPEKASRRFERQIRRSEAKRERRRQRHRMRSFLQNIRIRFNRQRFEQ